MTDLAIRALIERASPLLRIDGAHAVAWRRNVKKGPRSGPWKYLAHYEVLNNTIWNRPGEVIYFVTDAAERLRLVGQSSRCLKGRWRLSPMHDCLTNRPLGKHALFHSTAWPAIEAGIETENAPFLVSALFRPDLELAIRDLGEPLLTLSNITETETHRLSYHVEGWVCLRSGNDLWNRNRV